MGDISDMMLEGVLCECCGEYLGDGDGYPQKCSGRQKDANIDAHAERQAKAKKVKCATCGRKVKEIGLKDHMRDAHAKSGCAAIEKTSRPNENEAVAQPQAGTGEKT